MGTMRFKLNWKLPMNRSNESTLKRELQTPPGTLVSPGRFERRLERSESSL